MIKIVAVGKLKDRFYADALDEYIKRLSAFTKITVEQVADEKCGDNDKGYDAHLAKIREGDRILKNIKDKEYVITLEIKGRQLSSEAFSEKISSLFSLGYSDITFVIGGSVGLSNEVIDRADFHLSFSEMTFPHQLMRIILAEQIYRAFKIMKGEPYHK